MSKNRYFLIYEEKNGDFVELYATIEYCTAHTLRKHILPDAQKEPEFLCYVCDSGKIKPGFFAKINLPEMIEFLHKNGTKETYTKYKIPQKVIPALAKKYNFYPKMLPEVIKEKQKEYKRTQYNYIKMVKNGEIKMNRKINIKLVNYALYEAEKFIPSKKLDHKKYYPCGIKKIEFSFKECRNNKCYLRDKCKKYAGELSYIENFRKKIGINV